MGTTPRCGGRVPGEGRLAGRTEMIETGDNWQVGKVDDGWAERIKSLEDFDYGIDMRS